ncbi:MAG TPA: amidohydrolase family protein [Vicinamibacteria bacterium]|nr:amidohydrolase family protein [Vicinamibacteria bacterium]
MSRIFLLAWLLVCLSACAEVEAPSVVDDARATAFVDVNVVPMDSERVLEGQTVIVRDGRIDALGASGEIGVPAGAERIEGSGRYLMPGLAEMHGHLPSPNMPQQVTEDVLFLYVANGVTTVRGMQGNPSQLELRERIEAGELIGPMLVLGSPSMAGDRVETVEDARRLVKEYEEAGFDLLKVHEGLSAEVYAAIAETAGELNIPFGGHVTDHVGLLEALEAGQTTIDHLDNFIQALVPEERMPDEPPGLRGVGKVLDLVDESRMDRVVQATRDADGSVVPTMVLWESGIFATRPSAELLEERSEVRYLPPDMVARWVEAVDESMAGEDLETHRRIAELRRRILLALHRGGVRILLGTDSPQIFSVPGFSIHREMALYVDVGMTPYEVLRSGTRVVGEYLGRDIGSVEVGKRADLILLEANPLEDVANVAKRAGVMVAGRYLPEPEIEERLAAIASRHAAAGGTQ